MEKAAGTCTTAATSLLFILVEKEGYSTTVTYKSWREMYHCGYVTAIHFGGKRRVFNNCNIQKLQGNVPLRLRHCYSFWWKKKGIQQLKHTKAAGTCTTAATSLLFILVEKEGYSTTKTYKSCRDMYHCGYVTAIHFGGKRRVFNN